MKHKCIIKVNEQGTDAVAVSCAEIMAIRYASGNQRYQLEFIADHQFIFYLLDTHKNIELFAGNFFNRVTVEKQSIR
jgi:serine protease inhibitor